MLKLLFLTIALLTLILNIALTYYLIRNRSCTYNSYKPNKEIISFDLVPYTACKEDAAETDILETEAMLCGIEEEQVV